jgi:hypothetical protein
VLHDKGAGPADVEADLLAQSRDEVRAKTATAEYASGWIDEFVQANASGAEAAMLTGLPGTNRSSSSPPALRPTPPTTPHTHAWSPAPATRASSSTSSTPRSPPVRFPMSSPL